VAVCFDEEFARLRGLHTEAYFLLLLMLTALTVVVLAQVVGIILVIALLTLPAAMAGHWARRLWQIMAGAVAISAAATTGGLALAYGPDWPAGAVIIVLTGAAYLALAAATGLGGRR
jgi:zinc transport system permease protein